MENEKNKKIFKEKIAIEETQINLSSDIKDNELNEFINKNRIILNKFIKENPKFLRSLKPVKTKNPPKIAKIMSEASEIGNVGPMAAIAGSISEISIEYLINKGSKYSIVDNGGDVAFINKFTNKKVLCGIYAGESPLSGKIALEFKNYKTPLGICSSSASVGYSFSYGRSDCVSVIAKKASVADSLATAIANKVNGKLDEDAVINGINASEKFKDDFIGVLIIVGESIATNGRLPKIVEVENLNEFPGKYNIK